MVNSGRDVFPSRRESDLKFRIASEGIKVSQSVAKGEIARIDDLIPQINGSFYDKWKEDFGQEVNSFTDLKNKLVNDEKSRELANQAAPEAISMLMTAKGKEWWKDIDALDAISIMDVAEKNYLRDRLGEEIMGQLEWSSDGLPKLKKGHEGRLRLLHTVLAYDDAKKQIRVPLHNLSSRLKFYDDGINPDVVLDKMGVATERARTFFDWPEENHSTEAMNKELGVIFPTILESAEMLSENSKSELMDRLGVVKTEDGWSIPKDEKMSEAKRAMYVVVNQRLRNKNMISNNQKLKQILAKDGPDFSEVKKYSMDEMVLTLIANETAQDCGRYFQERVRREIINARIKEIRSLDEQRNGLTVRSERVFQGITRAGAEVAYFVQDMANIMRGVTHSILEKVQAGSFLEKVLGKASSVWQATAEIAKDVTDDLPSDFPDLARREQRRGSLKMPDLFAEFEGVK